ncbi:alkaline phosphatase family protein [Mycolicibacterium komossense]|uniref:Alkaline phosphatase family protein n=1 Tax=Mycolicibacterium komossense TaxID=1779 RepID=A0ABT3C9E4_9MYCO|nr:alkaline phosphatase family protein [Mycolicibacterium komossense]MCV7226031.1 alkaline phosphatase family protein [Mycolicibacterium komossense]
MTTVKQVCLGVAVAGVMAGAGAALATAEASAAPSDGGSGSRSSADGAASAASSAPKVTRGAKAVGETAPRTTGQPAAAAVSDTTVTTKTIRSTPRRAGAAEATVAPSIVGGTDTAQPVLKSVATTSASATIKATFDLVTPAPVTPAPAPLPVVPAAPTTSIGVSSSASWSARNRSVQAAVIAATRVVDPTKQHVLLIGVDGTNLSRILADPANQNFFALMGDGTTAAASIVGHTTISNPSWTSILTGVWDTKSGVVNNIFTPGTYNSWPTVFNQLEGFNPDIETKAIADWNVITDIAGAGSLPADQIVYIPQISGDTDWSQTDAAVTAETIKSLQGGVGYENVPNFMFTYLVQVDENGHMYGGASPQYAAAIERTDTNIGDIMAAVKARELATGEEWTVIVVTDHGHQPQQGFGHGFQSPDETSTFVIARGSDFDAGQINTKYRIVDVTPTIVTLFGSTPTADADGVSLTSLGQSQVNPVNLHQALNDIIQMNGYPDIPTDVALSVRTIFGAIPYYINGAVVAVTDQLQAVADQGIPVVSALAGIVLIPVQFIGNTLVAITQALAEVVGRLTGAGVIPPSTSTTQQFDLPRQAAVLV